MGYSHRGMRGYLSGFSTVRATSIVTTGAITASQFRASADGTTAEFAFTWDADPDLGMRRTSANGLAIGVAANTPISVSQFSLLTGEGLSIAGGYVNTSVISPTAISGAQNDYNPTSWNGQRGWVRQDISAAASLTGLTATSAGHTVWLFNITTTAARNLTLNHENAGSAAANRFLCPNLTDHVLQPQEGCMLLYDGTSSRWRVIGTAAA